MDPYTWIYIAAMLVSAYAANEQADKQAAAVSKNAALKENDRRRQEDELQRQSVAQMNDAARKAQADAALFDVISGEYGGGKTIDRARAVSQIQYGEGMSTLAQSAKAGFSQLGMDGRTTAARAESQLASIDRPSLLGTAIQIGGYYYDRQQYVKPKSAPQTWLSDSEVARENSVMLDRQARSRNGG